MAAGGDMTGDGRTPADAVACTGPRPATGSSGLGRVCLWLAVPYALSLATLRVSGVPATMPWEYLLPFTGIAVPYAYCLARLLLALDTRLPARASVVAIVGLVLGIGGLAALPQLGEGHLAILAVFYGLLLFDVRRLPRGYFQGLALALVALVLGLGTVCNVNYLLAPEIAGRLNDPALMRLDLVFYRWIFGRPTAYQSLFPLVDGRTSFHLLETAYHVLFAELFVVMLALLWSGRDVGRFLRALFLAYFTGLIVFAAYPAVGPCIHYPETFRSEFTSSATHHLMQKLAVEFGAATARAPVNGIAYFIAMPSLHTALAVLCQCFLGGMGLLYWTFLPVNVAVVVSTVALGYHYVVDIPAGILLGLVVARLLRDGLPGVAAHAAGPGAHGAGRGRQVPA